MRVIEFTIPEPLPTLNAWQRMHWTRRRKEAERIAWLVKIAVGRIGEPIERCRIDVERRAKRLSDPDNLIAKHLLDALVMPSKRNPHGLGLIVDDGPQHVVDLRKTQAQAARGMECTAVRIEEIAA